MTAPFPLIEVSGTPHERGRQHGQQAAARIRKGVAQYSGQLARMNLNDAGIAALVRAYRPPRPSLEGTISATVAMVVMQPSLGIMEVAPLPAIGLDFTTYTLPIDRAATRAAVE